MFYNNIRLFVRVQKKSSGCEKWEVRDENYNNGGCIDWSCTGSHIWQLNFCGYALKDEKVVIQ
jgi:hypothetical protein